MNKTASTVISIVLIGIIFLTGIIFIFLTIENKNGLQTCMDNENLNCMNYTCPSVDGRPTDQVTTTCQMYAYRCVDETHVMCSYASGKIVKIDSADSGIINCTGKAIPCT